MLALAIIAAALILIALLRFGVIAEYGDEGFQLWAKAGFLKFKLLDDDKEKKPKKKKEKPKKERNLKEMLPGSLSGFMDTIKTVLKALSRLKRRLLIKQLTLYYTSAGENPAMTALQFGAANAVIGAIVPEIKKNFRVKRLDLRTWFDFTSTEQKIYAKITISIAVWEVFYVLFALLPLVTAIFKRNSSHTNKSEKSDKKERKDGEDNGESPNQRVDGNNDAKNEGDD
jgi:hypothetical protein